MAEDQGVNGDIWNNRAITLLRLFNWKQIGDTNMDLTGTEDDKYGVDGLMTCEDPLADIPQPVIIESKRYAPKSLSQSLVNDWIDRLKKKINECRNSEYLFDKFPSLQTCSTLNQGLIMCWIKDADETIIKKMYSFFEQYDEKSGISSNWVKICFFTNDRIVTLCSILGVVKKEKLEFYYPSQIIGNRTATYSKVLTCNYMCSDIILARKINKSNKKYVFYLGSMDSRGLKVLHSCLSMFQYAVKGENLTILYNHKDDEFRKIENDVKSEYEGVKVEFKPFGDYSIQTEPSIICQ